MNFQEWCQANGFTDDRLAAMDDDGRGRVLAMWKQEAGGRIEARVAAEEGWIRGVATVDLKAAGAGGDDLLAAERQRLEAIEARAEIYADRCGNADAQGRVRAVAAKAAADGWDARKAELEMLRASRPQGVFMHANRSQPGDQWKVAEASLLLARGVSGERLARDYGEPVVHAADRPEWRGLSLHALMRLTMKAAGMEPPVGRFTDTSIRAALQADRMLTDRMLTDRAATEIRAVGSWGPSTAGASLSGVLSNVANKLLLDGWNGAGTTWQTFARVGTDLSDFKQSTRYRMTGIGTFQVIPPGGEIKHVQVDTEAYTQQVGTRGAMIGLDRTMLVNDDLGAFDTIPRSLGRMGAIAVEKAVYTLLLQQAATFFTSGRGNLSTGAGSALADAGLTAAWKLAREQKDANGDPLMAVPTVLLVPPALETTAKKLNNSSAFVGSTTANTLLPEASAWQGLFTVVVAPYLGAALAPAGTTGSDAAWIIAMPPSDFSIMEVAFLNGRRAPTIESADSDFAMLGMQWRAYLDFGVATLEYRGGVRSAGS